MTTSFFMSIFQLFVVLLVTKSLHAIGTPSESIKKLDSTNYRSVISETELLFIQFYAPWFVFVIYYCILNYGSRCGHCKKIVPELVRAVARLRKNDIAVSADE
jgi:hypothetical protein